VLITIAGMIGGGKSSLTKLITEEFGGKGYFEDANSPILQKFYTASPEELEAKRYPFLLQLEFLNSRFSMIKKCLIEGDNPKVNTLDRSIYEDQYFMEVNHQLGRISDDEAVIYTNLLNNMLEELEELPKKAPDLLIYLKGSFETFKSRIENRGRSFEALDEETEAYFYKLWQGYDAWVEECYKASPVLIIDIDKFDYVNDKVDKAIVLALVKTKLIELGLLETKAQEGTAIIRGVYEFTASLSPMENAELLPEEEIKENLEEVFAEAFDESSVAGYDAKITKFKLDIN
jgi:deoxyadenosine/deoxycytidine kinase